MYIALMALMWYCSLFSLTSWCISWKEKESVQRSLEVCLSVISFQYFLSQAYCGTCFSPFAFVAGAGNRRLFNHPVIPWISAPPCSVFYNSSLTLGDVEGCSLSWNACICHPEVHSSRSIHRILLDCSYLT